MTRADPLDAFYLALEENPADVVTLLALADWSEEQGQYDDARCLRWAAERGYHPFRYSLGAGLTVSSSTFKEGWFWWAIDDPYRGSGWGHPRNCRLSRELWKRLRNTFEWPSAVIQQYQTAREAYEALCGVWSQVPPADRERSS